MRSTVGLAAAVVAALLVAACDEGGSGGEVETMPTEVRNPGSSPDNVRAAAAAVWPADVGADASDAPQTLPTRPNLVAVVDMSGSMSEAYCAGAYDSRAQAARSALAAWLESVPAEANMGLIVFEKGDVSLRVPLGTGNRQVFIEAVNRTEPAGETPLRDAVALARDVLEAQGTRQRGYGEYKIVIITDGAHSDGQDPAPVLSDIFGNFANPIEVHTIGFCIESSALNQPGLTFYRSANDPDELRRGLETATAEASVFDLTQFETNAEGTGQ